MIHPAKERMMGTTTKQPKKKTKRPRPWFERIITKGATQ
jgi:hypothetical protein